jgi:hypothetical protein
MTGQAWPVSLLFSMSRLEHIPQNSYYGDNNETPTIPAKYLTDQHLLENPVARQLARKPTQRYWRQSVPDVS